MMSDTVIQVEGLSKRYRLGRSGTHADLRETVSHWLGRLSPRSWRQNNQGQNHHGADGAGQSTRDESEKAFWALRDVNFSVQRGQVLGVIGRNGAGKSTLLKILSRITSPTQGRITIDGRVGSLLEVGTGFHPELTGRENIFLNGAVLGMTQREVKRKFDAIVDFAGVEKFLDTPVKRYSSGMYVRLAFAVAAHLEPEVLIVDEVLAVGDAAFQARCLGRMREVAGNGRTVLFVSHNMAAVVELCQQVILLEHGRVAGFGTAQDMVRRYLKDQASHKTVEFIQAQKRDHPVFTWARTLDGSGQPVARYLFEDRLRVQMGIWSPRRESLIVGLTVKDEMGRLLLHMCNEDDGFECVVQPGEQIIELSFSNLLNQGSYYITLWIGSRQKEVYHQVSDCLVVESDTTMRGQSLLRGAIIIPGQWSNSQSGYSPWNQSDMTPIKTIAA